MVDKFPRLRPASAPQAHRPTNSSRQIMTTWWARRRAPGCRVESAAGVHHTVGCVGESGDEFPGAEPFQGAKSFPKRCMIQSWHATMSRHPYWSQPRRYLDQGGAIFLYAKRRECPLKCRFCRHCDHGTSVRSMLAQRATPLQESSFLERLIL
jgi:hypothetical protein